MSQSIEFNGPAGRIEGLLDDVGSSQFAVLCHPHPLYGGSMHDGVLDIAARAASARGLGTLKFNFRGVGGSEGTHADGDGEVEDLLAALSWLHAERDVSRVLLIGYSFGASVAWRTACDPTVNIAAITLVAPPVGSLAFDGSCQTPTRVIAGDADSFVTVAELQAWCAARAELVLVKEADHFFSGQTRQLADALDAALGASVERK